jgi:hypothetical protein
MKSALQGASADVMPVSWADSDVPNTSCPSRIFCLSGFGYILLGLLQLKQRQTQAATVSIMVMMQCGFVSAKGDMGLRA